MRTRLGWIASGVVLVASFVAAPTVGAQDGEASAYEEEARAVFNAGRAAFDDGRFEDALGYFRRAYELSGRGELLYNIGITADRLRRDAEALEALEQYLRDMPEGAQRRDAEARVEVLRQHVSDGGTSEASPSEPADTPGPSATSSGGSEGGAPPEASAADSGGGGNVLSIIGPAVLGGLGLLSLGIVIGGLASTDDCLSRIGDTCVEERSLSGGGTALYAGFGGALIVGAVVWLIVGMSSDDSGERPVALTPNGVRFEL